MKTLTEMKKVHFMSRFSLLTIALSLIIGFSSCGNDDADIPKYSLSDVNGNYTGKMQTLVVQPTFESTASPEQGVDITAEVKDNNVLFKKFPVEDLIKSILGDNENTASIISAIGDVNYQVAYQASFNDNQDIIKLNLEPKPLEISFSIPTPAPTDAEETPDYKVKVTITAEENGTFTYENQKLNFTLHATEVTVNDEKLEEFQPTSFKFELDKK